MSDIRIINLSSGIKPLKKEETHTIVNTNETSKPEIKNNYTVISLKEPKTCCKPTCGTAKLTEMIYLLRDNFFSEYDKEEEKAKARNNLGVYSISEINNFLSNYYNKEDIDNLIQNLNLDELYYTKLEIDLKISLLEQQPDWKEIDQNSHAFIKNKPTGEDIPISNSNSNSITQTILDNEEVVAVALNDINSRIDLLSFDIQNIDKSIFILDNELPKTDIQYLKIYIIPSDEPGDNNQFTEWIRIKNEITGDYWEKLGEFKVDIDLDNYWNKDELTASSTEDTLIIQVAGKTIILEIPQQGTLTTTNIVTTGNPTITFANPTDGATLSYIIKDKQGNTIATGSGIENSITRTFDVNLDNFSLNPTKYDVFITTKKNGMESEVKEQELTITRKLKNPTITLNGVEYDSSRTLTLSHPKAGVTIQYSLDNGTTWLTYDPNNKPIINSTSTVLARAIKDDWINSDNASANVTVGTLKMYYSVILYDTENDKERDNPSTAEDIEILTSINKKSFPVTIPVSGYGRTCFAYGKNLGKLTSIKDDNGFEYISLFVNNEGNPIEIDDKYYLYVLQDSAEQFGHFTFNK